MRSRLSCIDACMYAGLEGGRIGQVSAEHTHAHTLVAFGAQPALSFASHLWVHPVRRVFVVCPSVLSVRVVCVLRLAFAVLSSQRPSSDPIQSRTVHMCFLSPTSCDEKGLRRKQVLQVNCSLNRRRRFQPIFLTLSCRPGGQCYFFGAFM